MSLYYEAATILTAADQQASLKSRVYNANGLKSQPTQLFALVSEAAKWSPILKEVVERSQLLVHERKLSPILAVLLVHDLLLAKKGIAAPTNHVLRLAIQRHKARIQAEFTKARLRRGFQSTEVLRQKLSEVGEEQEVQLNGTIGNGSERTGHSTHLRWIRINTIKTTLDEQLATTFAEYEKVDTVHRMSTATSSGSKVVHIDKHVPDLIALPRNTDLSTLRGYKEGLLIAQDKASCFPAFLLNPLPDDGDLLDACAAPGNKTTHLATLIQTRENNAKGPKIWACERDKPRALTLQQMVSLAGADDVVMVQAGQDFLRLDPSKGPWCNIGALLLDPSCSGSGIIGRDDMPRLVLPSLTATSATNWKSSRKRKRESVAKADSPPVKGPSQAIQIEEEPLDSAAAATPDRLAALAHFQTRLLTHAMSFPSARKITYSTCSIHAQENEHVVLAALASDVAAERGWRVLRREEQVGGLRAWPRRGKIEECDGNGDVVDACLRCDKGTEDGTQGFFVCGFVRKIEVTRCGSGSSSGEEEDDDDDWKGFGDSDGFGSVVV